MNRFFVGVTLSLIAVVLLAVSCVKEPTLTFKDIEQRSLKEWIAKYHPELLVNYQEEGGYYVEVLDRGVLDSASIAGKDVWLWYDFTGRDLEGNICETRDWKLAKQLGTYTDYTHYVPSFRFCGEETSSMMEGTYLATYNKLNIGYIAGVESVEGEFEVRYGTKLRLYLPSSIIATESADGGYEGQYAMEENKPLVVDLHIYGHVANPVAYEGGRVEAFAEVNGGLCEEHKAVKEESEEAKARRRRIMSRADDESTEEGEEEVDTRPLEFFDGRWHQPVDTMEHLLVNYAYSPTKSLDFNAVGADTMKYDNPMEGISENIYAAGDVYSRSDLDSRINAALVERFGAGISYDEVLEADSVKTKNTVKVWYIGRFLDGFIFDTNIDEVKEIIYGKVETEGKALSFSTRDPLSNEYILAWNYAIPTLRRGQWAAILSVSTYAYGLEGQTGSTTSTTTNSNQAYYDYANYYNYMNYMNSYYGYGYGNMYNNGYYGYNPYYYGYNYNYNTGTDESVTVTTTSTEIQAFTPLLFQVFVEK